MNKTDLVNKTTWHSIKSILADGTISPTEESEYLTLLNIKSNLSNHHNIRVIKPESSTIESMSISLEELGLTGKDDFTVENISKKFEDLIQKINKFQESYESQTVQYVAGDWSNEFAKLSPNEDEVKLLNNFVSLLPSEVKPVPLANALT